RAHAGRSARHQARERRIDRGRLVGRRDLLEIGGALLDAEPAQQRRLLDRPMDARADALGGEAERLEIDVRRDVGETGCGEGSAPEASIPTTRSRHPSSCLTAWWIGMASKNSLATMMAGPSGTSLSASCQTIETS